MSPCYDSRTNGQCHLRMLVELGGGSTLESGFDGLCMLFIIIHPIQLHCGSYLQKCASSVPTLEDSWFFFFFSSFQLSKAMQNCYKWLFTLKNMHINLYYKYFWQICCFSDFGRNAKNTFWKSQGRGVLNLMQPIYFVISEISRCKCKKLRGSHCSLLIFKK